MRIDAHHHLWDIDLRPQPWLVGSALDPVNRTFRLPELEPQLKAVGIDATVIVQSSSSLDETRELLAIAAGSGGVIAGVVGWADLTDPALSETLTDLAAAGPLVGIRHQVQDESDPEWLTRPEVRAGIRTVGRAGLVYDLLINPTQMDSSVAAVQAFPEITFVLDHGAKPSIATGAWDPWADQIAALAAQPNVSCKLSGLITEADWANWTPQDVLPYAHYLLDVFGPDRLMFGSDWPVCILAGQYADVYALAEEAIAGLNPAEREAVWGGTAARIYGLG